MEEIYCYKGTVIAVRPGLGCDNWATCRRKSNGGWTAVKSKEMPRVKTRQVAEENLRRWASNKGLKSARCDGCSDKGDAYCFRYHSSLERMKALDGTLMDIRLAECENEEDYT